MKPNRASWGRALLAGAALFAALPMSASASEWRKVENLKTVKGADGNMHTAQCSGYPGTDGKFSFWAKKGSSKNVMVFFEGGGACWENFTCSFPITGQSSGPYQFFVPAINPAAHPNTFDGVFKNVAGNPLRDWSVVYIPYCTGDLHTGSTTKTYYNAGNPDLPVPAFTIQHRGFDNFMVVLDWMKKNLDAPPEMLVTGVSAGGYGAALNFPWLARAYPEAKLSVLADASQGVTAPAFDLSPVGRNTWNPQLAPWVWGPPVISSKIPGNELLRVATLSHRHARFSQYTTSFDTVQIGFYGLMKQLYQYGGNCPSPDDYSTAVDWYQKMSQKLVSYAVTLPNYRFYLAGGQSHTILSGPSFFTESTAGEGFSHWLKDMVNGTVGGDWRNAACPTCLIPLPCP